MMNSKILSKVLLGLSLVGFIDAAYLTILHFQNVVPPCTSGGCESVLTSQYAEIGGVPIALIGMFYYFAFFIAVLIGRMAIAKILVSFGFIATLALISLQLFVIQAICLYCVISAVVTTLLFICTFFVKDAIQTA